MNLATAACFVFDFDGTLAPNLDLPGMRRGVLAMTRAAGVPDDVFADRYIIEIIDAARGWLAQRSPETAAAYHERAHTFIVDFELEAAARLDPFPAARQLLGRLRSAGKGTAVVTRNCEQAVRNTFPDIDEHLDVLLARDNVTHYKPDPRHLGRALELLAEDAERSVMIGDGQMDMRLGAAAGLICVGVLTGSSTESELERAGAHLVLPSIADLLDHV